MTLSYAELDKRANRLAYRLVSLGVGPEVPVGVMMERSMELIVALLGVLKAGGAFVPMDPDYPPDRLAIMVEDSEVMLISGASDLRQGSGETGHLHSAACAGASNHHPDRGPEAGDHCQLCAHPIGVALYIKNSDACQKQFVRS